MSPRSATAHRALVFSLGLLALALSGCSKSQADTVSATAITPPVGAAGGTHAITANEKGFSPSSVALKKGEKAELVFTRTTDATCATEVVFPEINLRKELPLNQPVAVLVPTDTARTLTFQCGMGMFKSAVVIN
jgi:plastocyanin domain-containing protein